MEPLKLYNITLSCNTPNLDVVEKTKTFFEENTKIDTNYAISKKTIPNFGIRRKSKIGFFVKLWGKKAKEFMQMFTFIDVNENSLNKYGTVTFAIKEYTNLKNIKYNPDIPMFGFTVNMRIHRPGLGIVKKSRGVSKLKPISIAMLKSYLVNNYKNINVK